MIVKDCGKPWAWARAAKAGIATKDENFIVFGVNEGGVYGVGVCRLLLVDFVGLIK